MPMGRSYAGILGPIAFATVIVRGLLAGADVIATLKTATAALFLFAAVGYVAGRIAAGIVRDSVHAHYQALAERKQQPDKNTQAAKT
jgi:hypothetical protein